MSKIIYLITGSAALLLSFIPSLQQGAPPYLEQQDALCLALFGLLNLTLAPVIPYENKSTRSQLQNLVRALIVLSVVIQTTTLLAPLHEVSGHMATMLSLVISVVAIALHLAVNFYCSDPEAEPQNYDITRRDTGTVKWFNTSKGFGFISRDSGDDIFVHFRAIRGEGHRVLVEGQNVEFSVINCEKGMQAEDVIASPPHRCTPAQKNRDRA